VARARRTVEQDPGTIVNGAAGSAAALAHLAADPVMARLAREHGPCTLQAGALLADPFEALVRSIIAQMLSEKAARTIGGRVAAALGGFPTAARLHGVRTAKLRAAGLSTTKAEAILELARRVRAGTLDLAALARAEDAAIRAALTSVRGIGPWTAEMFLIFHLGRPDVFPSKDVGLLEGLRRAYGLEVRPTPKEAEARAAAWAPHRTTASWYLWRALSGQAALP
jgi:DNA-3-methyladenine glycosylase II